MVTFIYNSLSDIAPAYLAADCQLSSDVSRRQLHSAEGRLEDLCRQANLQQIPLETDGSRLRRTKANGHRLYDYEQYCLSCC